MSKSRMINTSIWSDDYVLDLSALEFRAWMYLIANPESSLTPFYKMASKKVIAFLLGGISVIEVETLLTKFETDGKIKIKDNWIFLVNWEKHQKLNDNHCKGIDKAIEALPSDIKAFFYPFKRSANPTLSHGDAIPKPSSSHTQPIPSHGDNGTELNGTELNGMEEEVETSTPPDDFPKFLENLKYKLEDFNLKETQEEALIREFTRLYKEFEEFRSYRVKACIRWLELEKPDWKTKNPYFKIRDFILQDKGETGEERQIREQMAYWDSLTPEQQQAEQDETNRKLTESYKGMFEFNLSTLNNSAHV